MHAPVLTPEGEARAEAAENVAFRRALLARLAALSEKAVDARLAAPEAPPPAERLHRPLKRVVTMRLDADVLAWFKARCERGYQTEINRALRRFAEAAGEGPLRP